MLSQPPRGAFDYLLKPPAMIDPPDRIEPPVRKAAAPSAPPPAPPERWGGNPRIRVEIEILHRRQQPNRTRFSVYTLIWIIVLVGLLSMIDTAHGQTYTSHKQGFTTYTEGSDGLRARSYQQGFTTYTEIENGNSTQRCRTWKQGWQTITQCD